MNEDISVLFSVEFAASAPFGTWRIGKTIHQHRTWRWAPPDHQKREPGERFDGPTVLGGTRTPTRVTPAGSSSVLRRDELIIDRCLARGARPALDVRRHVGSQAVIVGEGRTR